MEGQSRYYKVPDVDEQKPSVGNKIDNSWQTSAIPRTGLAEGSQVWVADAGSDLEISSFGSTSVVDGELGSITITSRERIIGGEKISVKSDALEGYNFIGTDQAYMKSSVYESSDLDVKSDLLYYDAVPDGSDVYPYTGNENYTYTIQYPTGVSSAGKTGYMFGYSRHGGQYSGVRAIGSWQLLSDAIAAPLTVSAVSRVGGQTVTVSGSRYGGKLSYFFSNEDSDMILNWDQVLTTEQMTPLPTNGNISGPSEQTVYIVESITDDKSSIVRSYGKAVLPAPLISPLTVSAAARVGGQTVTVTEAVDSGLQRRYKIGAKAETVAYNAACSTADGWTAFPANGQVTGTAGQVITVVDCTTSGANARKVGSATLPAPQNPPLGEITVTAAARVGGQTITLSPGPASTENIAYKVGAKAETVTAGQVITPADWTVMPANGEISETAGQVITVIYADKTKNTISSAGSATLPEPTPAPTLLPVKIEVPTMAGGSLVYAITITGPTKNAAGKALAYNYLLTADNVAPHFTYEQNVENTGGTSLGVQEFTGKTSVGIPVNDGMGKTVTVYGYADGKCYATGSAKLPTEMP